MAARCLPSLSLGLIAALAGGWALAQSPEKKPDLVKETENLVDLLTLLNTPITTASKRAEKAIEAPSVVSVITRDQFQAYGWASVNDALYSLPGFGPARDYDRRTVSSRGLFEGWNNNHILLLVDGIPYNDNIYGSAYTSEITPIFMIKTLEVVRGPGSALYGSNATNSATQLRTVTPLDLAEGGEAQLRIGSKGDRIYDFAMGKDGDLLSTVVAFNAFHTGGNGYDSYDGSQRTLGGVPTAPLAKFPVNDERENQYGWIKLTGNGDLRGWGFQFHHQAWDYKTGHGWAWQIPDLGERLSEKRQLASLGFTGKLGDRWSQEYLFRYQKHEIQWDIRFYPASATYPAGVYEYLDTSASDLFLRTQWSVDLPKGSSLLFGMEGTRFAYDGDKSHASNVDMATFAPTPSNAMLPLGPWLGFIQHDPILNTGFYAQFSSGKLLGSRFKGVLGIRSDHESFDYHKLDATHTLDTGQTGSKSYSQTSPRLALVFTPMDNLAIKAMWGRAFRAPAPAELAGASTLTLASNIEKLKPETLETAELAVDWIINPNLNWRTNIYRTKFSNEIAYSAANLNLSANIYTLTTEGLETELLFGFAGWRGYVNYSYAKRVNEQILDSTITASPNRLTWDPASRFKFGVIYTAGPVVSALTGYYQSITNRRSTDIGVGSGSQDIDLYRPADLAAWFTLDAKVTWNFTSSSSLALYATNLLDTDKNKFIKVQAFPFDYQGEGRRYGVVMKTNF
jgi:iron complex outermembrane receptor protein